MASLERFFRADSLALLHLREMLFQAIRGMENGIVFSGKAVTNKAVRKGFYGLDQNYSDGRR